MTVPGLLQPFVVPFDVIDHTDESRQVTRREAGGPRSVLTHHQGR